MPKVMEERGLSGLAHGKDAVKLYRGAERQFTEGQGFSRLARGKGVTLKKLMQGGEVATSFGVKDAVKIALDYFRELFGSPYGDLALEEVGRTRSQFVITIGYTPARQTPAGPVVVPGTARQYKEIRVDATTGEVISMKVKRV
jgi:hypothetical protein